MILVFQINQTFFLFTVGGSSDGEQWPVVKQVHQTLKRTPEIDFTLEPARKHTEHQSWVLYTHDDNTENLMYECGKQTSVSQTAQEIHIFCLL